MKYIRAFIYWIAPQRAAIANLKRQIKARDDLILTLRASHQSTKNENAKLWNEVARLRLEIGGNRC